MIVDVGGAGSRAEREPTGPTRGGPGPAPAPAPASAQAPAPGHRTRRRMMRGLLAPALALTLAPLVAASRPSPASDAAEDAGSTGPARPEPHPVEPATSAAFDETYRGRRIRGVRAAAGHAVGAAIWHVTVDGRPLHLMRRADGGWLSMVDHYRSYPTPLAAARGAVDELGPGEHLHDAPADDGRHHSGGHHGVHA
ncbi:MULTISPECIES: tyrosinase cofactor [unclassified Streptomyces]|uniref:tyrosinase cofactor n=1 Tax=unclassified Streptomyces TaxID=2593676 RepID=UPI002442F379|nr:tyrosinase cofactor [Streptomyces sp. DH41]MDG9721486.1 tyrosinase cofactor [Streptomyces sp. DH41]